MACIYLHNFIKRVETPISPGKDTAAHKRAAFACNLIINICYMWLKWCKLKHRQARPSLKNCFFGITALGIQTNDGYSFFISNQKFASVKISIKRGNVYELFLFH